MTCESLSLVGRTYSLEWYPQPHAVKSRQNLTVSVSRNLEKLRAMAVRRHGTM